MKEQIAEVKAAAAQRASEYQAQVDALEQRLQEIILKNKGTTMTKKELIAALHQRLDGGTHKATVENVVNQLLDTIGDELAAGRPVVLPGFGKFEPRVRPARKGRNPRTGEPLEIGERRTVAFKPHKGLAGKAAE